MTIRTYPFGWLTPYLAPIIRAEPDKFDLYLSLSRADWHYFGLIIALMGDNASCPDHFRSIERDAFVRPRLNVLREVSELGSRPLLKLTPKLSGNLWRPSSYRRLATMAQVTELLEVLRRRDRIGRKDLRRLSQVPMDLLHPAVLRRMDKEPIDRVVFLVQIVRRVRRDLTDVQIFASLNDSKKSGGDVQKWAALHYQHAPFPTPPWGGSEDLSPVTEYSALKQVALEFDNCVRSYLEEVLGGRSCFYRYAPGGKPVAVVEIAHLPHVGWSVGEISGPKNGKVATPAQDAIKKQFARVGISTIPETVDTYYLFRPAA